MKISLDTFLGPTLGSMISDMQEKQSGSFNQTFHFYSGHDTTIVNLLRTLGIYDNKPPPYGASVIIELRRKDTDYIVTVSQFLASNDLKELLSPLSIFVRL